MYLKDLGNFLSTLGGSSPPEEGGEGEGGDSSANEENIFLYQTDLPAKKGNHLKCTP
jgi:hypothetical protein